MSWEIALVFLIVVLFSGLVFLIVHWPKHLSSTFSQHAAESNYASVYYSLLFVLTLPFISYLLAIDFAAQYSLNDTFRFFIWASAVIQIACSLVPETKGLQKTVHQLLAGTSAAALLVAALSAATTMAYANELAFMVTSVVMIGASAIGINKSENTPLAIVQLVYYGSFFAAVTYLAITAI